jgi:hypothetical protein
MVVPGMLCRAGQVVVVVDEGEVASRLRQAGVGRVRRMYLLPIGRVDSSGRGVELIILFIRRLNDEFGFGIPARKSFNLGE